MNIKVDCINISHSYGGALEGVLSYDSVVQNTKQWIIKNYGIRATHIIEPVLKEWNGNKYLPTYKFIAWLNGPQLDSDEDGSELVLVWFSDNFDFNQTVLTQVLTNIEWKNVAKDYSI